MNLINSRYLGYSLQNGHSLDDLNDLRQALQETITELEHKSITRWNFLAYSPYSEIIQLLENEKDDVERKIKEKMSWTNIGFPHTSLFPNTYIPKTVTSNTQELEQRVDKLESTFEKFGKKLDNSMSEFHQDMDKNMTKINHVSDYLTSIELTKDEESTDESKQ